MKDLAPDIYRQRLIIEGLYTVDLEPLKLEKFMKSLSEKLAMTIIYGPYVKNLAGELNPFHQGYECIMIWAESGTSIYTWDNQKFFTVDIYSCKEFNNETAVEFTKEFFKATDIVHKSV